MLTAYFVDLDNVVIGLVLMKAVHHAALGRLNLALIHGICVDRVQQENIVIYGEQQSVLGAALESTVQLTA